MPKGRTQPRAWFVKFWLLVPAAPAVDRSDSDVGSEHEPSVISPSDAEIRMCLTEVFDGPIREGRRIRCLQHVSFAYKARDPTMSADTTPGPAESQVRIVDVIGFAHGGESILDTTMYSWIQDPRVIDQQWTPIHIKQGAGGNWWQQEIIRGFFSDCECGRRVRVDYLWTGDLIAPVAKGGRKKRQRQAPDLGEASIGATASARGDQRNWRALASIDINTMRAVPAHSDLTDNARATLSSPPHPPPTLPPSQLHSPPPPPPPPTARRYRRGNSIYHRCYHRRRLRLRCHHRYRLLLISRRCVLHLLFHTCGPRQWQYGCQRLLHIPSDSLPRRARTGSRLPVRDFKASLRLQRLAADPPDSDALGARHVPSALSSHTPVSSFHVHRHLLQGLEARD